MRPGLIGGVAVSGCLLLTGCQSSVTSARLERSIAATFTNLLVLQQDRIGRPPVFPGALQAQATCYRGSPSGLRTGAGEDWQCRVDYSTPGGPSSTRFDVQAKTDGCYKADGTVSDVGPATLTSEATGAQVANPLVEFDGCFDASLGAP
jgi:hypothetical protein